MLTYCEIKPAVNQIEVHPYMVQDAFCNFLDRLGIAVEAYAPLTAKDYDKKPPEAENLHIFEE